MASNSFQNVHQNYEAWPTTIKASIKGTKMCEKAKLLQSEL
jgi:hypothetical protein